jgi:hypothetical protein
VRFNKRVETMWHCGADICVSKVHSNKPRKKFHKQVPEPLTVHQKCKRHILKSITPSALHCVYQQVCLQFLSPYCTRVCVPARLSTVPVTILHYSVCANKTVYSSCHHTTLQCVCQQGSVQFLSPHYITVCVPARLSAVCC